MLLTCKSTNIRFITIYRTGYLDINDRSKFLEELNDYLELLMFKKGINILWGDFNICKEQIANKVFYGQFIDLLESKGYKLVVDKPTHEKNGVLDLVFIPTNLLIDTGSVTIYDHNSGVEVSDHYPIKIQLPLEAETKKVVQECGT